MYDQIKFCLPNVLSREQIEKIIIRFALYKSEERNKTFYHNAQNTGLKQCKGIYIKIENDFIFIELSLHKFWNELNGRGLRNDNNFTFEQATTTIFDLQRFLEFEILQSKVYFYEYGLNIKATNELSFFTNDIIGVKAKDIHEFTWVVYHKKFKVYSTERRKVIRTVFVIYDKTYEMLQKDFFDVEPNLIRIEIKHKRIENKKNLLDLFTNEQKNIIMTNLKKNFIDNIIFKKNRDKNTNLQDYLIYENIKKFGVDYTKDLFWQEFKNGVISQRTYKRRIGAINMIKNNLISIKESPKDSENVFKNLVKSALGHFWHSSRF